MSKSNGRAALIGTGLLAATLAITPLAAAVEKVRDAAERAH